MALKLNLNKAYEKISRSAIIEVMRRLGFCAKWCGLINECTKSPSFSIMINGKPSPWFDSSCGIT